MPEPQDVAARKNAIARSAWFTVPGTLIAAGAAYALTLAPIGLVDAGARLLYAFRWLFVAFLPYAAVCLHILYARFAEGSHNPLLGAESERLQVHCRVMQNTLEQLVWFALCVLALASYLTPPQMRLVPIVCVLFAVARGVYWWGYLRSNTLGRAPGVQMTFTLNIPLLVAVLLQSGQSIFG
ncbi:MAG: MAPEG family protein [Rubrivivax sp.]